MKQQLEQLIQLTCDAFLSTVADKSRFYDLTLSLVAWKAFSTDPVASKYSQPLKTPGPDHAYDLVMKHFSKPDHKENVYESLFAWEKANPQLLTELLAVDHELIRNIPLSTWKYICRSWIDFFAIQRSANIPMTELMVSIMDELELSLSKDRIIYGNYAPKELVGLMVNLLNSKPGQSLYDPYSWSGAFLSAAAQHLQGLTRIEGFAVAALPWKLAKLRLLLLPIPAEILIEKGLNYYKLPSNERFDLILMNPPYGQRETPNLLTAEHGAWSELGNSSNRIDLAMACHSLNRLSSEGSAAILLPGIFLSGQGALLEFRWRIIQNNLLDTVITLPPGVFPQTGVSTTILFFNKNKRDDKVFMLDATSLVKGSANQVCLDEAAINHYIARRREKTINPDNHCLLISNEEIAKKRFDLKFTSYIRTDQQLVNPFPPSATLLEECIRISAEYQLTEQKIKQLIQNKKKPDSNPSMHGTDKN